VTQVVLGHLEPSAIGGCREDAKPLVLWTLSSSRWLRLQLDELAQPNREPVALVVLGAADKPLLEVGVDDVEWHCVHVALTTLHKPGAILSLEPYVATLSRQHDERRGLKICACDRLQRRLLVPWAGREEQLNLKARQLVHERKREIFSTSGERRCVHTRALDEGMRTSIGFLAAGL